MMMMLAHKEAKLGAYLPLATLDTWIRVASTFLATILAVVSITNAHSLASMKASSKLVELERWNSTESDQSTTTTDQPHGAQITKFQVPASVRLGDWFKISCLHELKGETLYAVTLLKDKSELYRFSPISGAKLAQKRHFDVPGLQVDLKHSNEHIVRLKAINKQAQGNYKCQVRVDGTFRLLFSAEKHLQVVDGPAIEPKAVNLSSSSFLSRAFQSSASRSPSSSLSQQQASTRASGSSNWQITPMAFYLVWLLTASSMLYVIR